MRPSRLAVLVLAALATSACARKTAYVAPSPGYAPAPNYAPASSYSYPQAPAPNYYPQPQAPAYGYPQTPAPSYPQPAPAYGYPQPSPAPYVASPYGVPYAMAYDPGYLLDAGDKLRVVVFGQEGLTNTYTVDAQGYVTVPLIGPIPARGTTTAQLSAAITERLRQGYIRDPNVAVEIESYRPFFILGEVNTPGQYPYVAHLTAESAIAIAGGFSPRAKRDRVEVSRNINGQIVRGVAPLNYQIQPGDTVRVSERWF